MIWQTGTADAMRGVSTDDFQTTLEQAVGKLREGGADVIFMNPQYNPRTDAVIATAPYAEAIRWVALRQRRQPIRPPGGHAALGRAWNL